MRNKILLVGPKKNIDNPALTGGAIILFEHLLDQYAKYNKDYLVVDTNKKNYSNILFAYLSIYYQIFIKQFKAKHISLHSSRDYLYFMPYILILGKIFNKTTSLRKFGGEAWKTYSHSKGINRLVLKYIFTEVDYLFLEIQYLVESFKALNYNSYWFPNVRNKPNIPIKNHSFSKRFAFISHIKKSKGIDSIIELDKRLGDDYVVDIYGSIIDEKIYSEEYFKNKGVSYKGALIQEEVLEILSTYDVLLLPTTWKNEGYPGIIIESYSLGIPVIATNLKGISEIIDDYKSGILIEPNDVDSLKAAVEHFTKDNYDVMSSYAKSKFKLFDGDKQSIIFIELLEGYTPCKVNIHH